jgi:hypothetical protein
MESGYITCSAAACGTPVPSGRAENSHRPPRRREHQMHRFTSPKQAPGFFSVHPFIQWPLSSASVPTDSQCLPRGPD